MDDSPEGDRETETKQLSASTMMLVQQYASRHPSLTKQSELNEIINTAFGELVQSDEHIEQNSQDVAKAQAELKAKILNRR